ncbi:MAG: AbrB/MazE/SpoVT family DNA-binding domain-containing protein [Propionibacteriaceae bacterium]|jgi:AbrB family looped-hinge helix DNA binding protein|nr:AbrB/MazE/SpoVT family DNA-binding domain-containing protein [Propionibacteriaceae bacterium]
MTVATVTSKGQVTVPVAIREALGLTAGTRLDFTVAGPAAITIRVDPPTLTDLRGVFSAGGVHLPIAQFDEAIGQAVSDSLDRA